MRTWTLAIVIAGLLAGSVSAANDALPPERTATVSSERLVNLAWRVRGRILGSLVRKGMTDDEVVRLLGNGDKPLPTGGVVGGTSFWWRRYFRQRLTVSFINDGAGAGRVQSVEFGPLLD